MEVETPATVAILGAGPIGLEAALYARFLGYDVIIFDRGRIAENVRRWGHVRMFSPFGLNRSPLGLAALAAHDAAFAPPADDALLTGGEWVARYLEPLSQTDLLADRIREHTTVIAVGRQSLRKGELVGREDRADSPFRILLRDASGAEQQQLADVVIDTTGVFATPNWLGPGGAPAIGEIAARADIEYDLPDVLGADRERFGGRHTLLVGSGHSAATTIVALAQLAREAAGTRVTWVVRRGEPDDSGDATAQSIPAPVRVLENDRLPQRRELCEAANRCAAAGNGAIEFLAGTAVESIARDGRQFVIELSGRSAGQRAFDNLVANVGYRGDPSLFDELQVHLCYASGGPMKLAAALLGQASADCLDQTACGPQSLLNSEPNFYILGAKSYARSPSFLVSVGLQQIRELFSLIAGRENLDLYATVRR